MVKLVALPPSGNRATSLRPSAVPASSRYAGGAPVDGGRHWKVRAVPSVTAVAESGGGGTSGGPTANDTSSVEWLVLSGPVVRTRAKYEPGGTEPEIDVASAAKANVATSLAPSLHAGTGPDRRHVREVPTERDAVACLRDRGLRR